MAVLVTRRTIDHRNASASSPGAGTCGGEPLEEPFDGRLLGLGVGAGVGDLLGQAMNSR